MPLKVHHLVDHHLVNFIIFNFQFSIFSFLISLPPKKAPLVMDAEMIKTIQDYFKTQPVLKAWLFGSYARGEETPDSDVDILVVFDQKKGNGVSLLKHISIALGLEDVLRKRVDLITEGTLLPFAKTTADKDKILIYERAN